MLWGRSRGEMVLASLRSLGKVDAAPSKSAVTETCRFDPCREHCGQRGDGYQRMGRRQPYKGLAGDRALALSVIHQAVKEMRATRQQRDDDMDFGAERDWPSLRRRATVWLATTQAAVWFEGSGLDQGHALAKIGWAGHARELLENEAITLGHARIQVLERGLDAIGSTE